MRAAQYKKKLELTEHSEWARAFWEALVPYKDKVVAHPVFSEMASGELSAERWRRALDAETR